MTRCRAPTESSVMCSLAHVIIRSYALLKRSWPNCLVHTTLLAYLQCEAVPHVLKAEGGQLVADALLMHTLQQQACRWAATTHPMA